MNYSYIDSLFAIYLERHKDSKTIRRKFLDSVVNSEYSNVTNYEVTRFWSLYNKQFPS